MCLEVALWWESSTPVSPRNNRILEKEARPKNRLAFQKVLWNEVGEC